MQLGVAAGTLAGAAVLGAPAGAWAAVSLGVALIAYSAWALFGKPLAIPVDAEKWLGLLVGIVTGFITAARSEEHTSELQSLMRISYAVFCLKKKKNNT